MTKAFTTMIPPIAGLLLFVLMGGPQLAPAWAAPQQTAQQDTSANTGTTAPPQSGSTNAAQQDEQAAPSSDMSEQPKQQPNAQSLPDSPSATQQGQQAPAQPNKKDQAPLGAAAAQQGVTAGGAASKPAGSAIAPAKQRQVRSLLIKLGVIAAGGAAIGAVYALTRGTSSTPPGAR
jgi:hypothetical protein